MSVEISISNRLKETLEKIEKGEICSAYIQENIKRVLIWREKQGGIL